MRAALFLSGVCAALAFAGERTGDLLAFDRQGILAGEVWRLWTGHLVHHSAGHAALDIVAFFVLAWAVERETGARAVLVLLAAAMPVISFGLLLGVPAMLIYKGSSALAALLGAFCAAMLWRREPRLRLVLGGFGILAIAKTYCDALGVLPGFSSLPVGVQTAWQAHVIGGCVALIWAEWLHFFREGRTPSAWSACAAAPIVSALPTE